MTRDLLFIVAMMAVGLWLDGKGGNTDLVDRCLTPWGYGFGGGAIVLLEHWLAA